MPSFISSFPNNVICITLPTFHLICLGLGSAINMNSKQIVTSKEKAVILDCFTDIFIFNLFIIFIIITLLISTLHWLACTSQRFFPVVLSFPFVKLWLSIPASNCSPVVIYTGFGIITAVFFSCCCIHVCKSSGYVKEPKLVD